MSKEAFPQLTKERLGTDESRESPPLPLGSIPNLEYISGLQAPENLDIHLLQSWIVDNFIAESFQLAIRRHRDYPLSLSDGEATMDSRFITARPPRSPIWRGTVFVGLLSIHGQPHPNEKIPQNYSYTLSMPIDKDGKLDTGLQLAAGYKWGGITDLKSRGGLIYNSHAFPEYDEHDAGIFIQAAKEAAYDLSRLLRYENGEII